MEHPVLFPRYTAIEVATLLKARETSPGQWQSACPAHSDLGEHLSIHKGKPNCRLTGASSRETS